MKHPIVFISADDPDVGAPHHTMAAIWFVQQGHDLVFIGPGENDKAWIYSPLTNVPRISVSKKKTFSSKILWYFRVFFKALMKLRTSSGSILWVYGSVVTPVACLLLLFKNVPLVYHTQDYLEPSRHPVWVKFEKYIARKSARVICNEPNRARFMASNYKLKELPIVVRTALPSDWPTPDFDMDLRNSLISSNISIPHGSERLIMHQGSFSDVRCSRQLIEAFLGLPQNYFLVVTGVDKNSPVFDYWNQIVCRNCLSDRVIYLDYLSFDELLKYTACCDIGLLLYPNDGVGNYYQAPGRLTEYLRCGLQIVSSNFPGLELLNLKYCFGEVCNPTRSAEIASAIKSLGDLSTVDLQRERVRLHHLSKTELSYDRDAWKLESIVNDLSMEEGDEV